MDGTAAVARRPGSWQCVARWNLAYLARTATASSRISPAMRFHFVVLTGLLSSAVGFAQGNCAGSRDLHLVNGRIVTMDARNTIASEVTIQDGRIDTVGPSKKQSACTKTVN